MRASDIVPESSVDLGSIYLEANGDCNLSCRYCYAQRIEVRLDEKIVQEFLCRYIDDYLAGNPGPFLIYWIGRGEVTLWKPLADCVNVMNHRYGAKIMQTIQTNGILIRDIADRVKMRDNLTIALSLDGLEDAHDFNRGRGTFQAIVRNIRKLVGMQIPVSFKTILLPRTIETAPRFLEFIEELAPGSDVVFNDCFTSDMVDRIADAGGTMIRPPISDAELLRGREFLAGDDYAGVRSCIQSGAYYRYLCVACTGEIYNCCEFQVRVGDMKTGIPELKNRLMDASSCVTCKLSDQCFPKGPSGSQR